MAQVNLAGRMWPSADVIPEGHGADEYVSYFGIRYARPEDPERTPHLDTPAKSNKSALTMRLCTLQQAPVMSARSGLPLVNMLHLTPSAITPRPGLAEVGEAGPDFTLVSIEDGKPVRSSDFWGRNMLFLFQRIMQESLFCPYSIPSTERMKEFHQEFEKRGVQVAVVLPTTLDKARSVARTMELPYTVFADPEWSACSRYCRILGMLPLQASAMIDGEGIVRYSWKSDGGPGGDSLPPMPSLLLKEAIRVFKLPEGIA